MEILPAVGRAAAIVLGLFLIIRWADMFRTGAMMHVLSWDRATGFFLLETGMVVAAVLLFASQKVQRNANWLYHTAQLAVLGFIVGRLNIAVTGFEVVNGKTYVPAWTEIAVTGMLVTIGVTAFALATRYLPVLEPEEHEAEAARAWLTPSRDVAGVGPVVSKGV